MLSPGEQAAQEFSVVSGRLLAAGLDKIRKIET